MKTELIKCDSCNKEIELFDKLKMISMGANNGGSWYIKTHKSGLNTINEMHFCDVNCFDNFFIKFDLIKNMKTKIDKI